MKKIIKNNIFLIVSIVFFSILIFGISSIFNKKIEEEFLNNKKLERQLKEVARPHKLLNEASILRSDIKEQIANREDMIAQAKIEIAQYGERLELVEAEIRCRRVALYKKIDCNNNPVLENFKNKTEQQEEMEHAVSQAIDETDGQGFLRLIDEMTE